MDLLKTKKELKKLEATKIEKELDSIKCGIEIHQQLDSHKLFCDCPSILRKDQPDFEIMRKFHAVTGESGETDIASKHEAEQNKKFIYQGYNTSNCLVELDEEPPHKINQEALNIALHIALHLNCEILSISQIMRKTVIDGSNTSGFQRTVLIARNGWINTSQGKVRIDSINLEEDAARIIEKQKDKIIYKLDRLGIPLIEIATKPDIRNPEQAKETALCLGEILRSCKVKRGIGTIRQDINISIPNHPRTEIKGFQNIQIIIPTIKKEIQRQKENIKKNIFKSEVRKALANGKTEFLRPVPGAARMYPETDLPLLKISREMINNAKNTLPKLKGEIKKDLEKTGLKENEIKILLKQNKLNDFENLLKIIKDPNIIFKILIEIPKEIISHEKIKNPEKILNIDLFENIAQAIADGKITKKDIKHILTKILRGEEFSKAIKIEKIDLIELEKEIVNIIKEKPGLNIKGYMGLIMKKFKGRVSGQDSNKILKRILNLQ